MSITAIVGVQVGYMFNFLGKWKTVCRLIVSFYTLRNSGLDESQAGIKIPDRNTNNFSYADDTTLTAQSEKELKSLLMKVKKESEKLRLNSTLKN